MNKTFAEGLKPSRLLTDPKERLRVVGWSMKPEEVFLYFRTLQKKVVSLFGFSSPYEDNEAVLKIAKEELSQYSPEKYLVNIGATKGGIGAAYPLAKSMGFITTGIVSSVAIEYADEISPDVDHICFITDQAWGGKLPGSTTLTPTSQAMVACSDIFIGIGGGEITREEMLAGLALGKPVRFHPAEMEHAWALRRAEKNNRPAPVSFWGAAHEELTSRVKE